MVSIKLFLWSHERPAHLPSVGEQTLAQVHTLQTSCRVVEHSSRSEAALVSSAPTLRLMILLILSLTTLVSWYCLTQCDVTIYSVTLSIIILLILLTLTTVINSICVSVLPAERLWSWWWCSDGGLLHWDTTSVIICQWPGDEVMRWTWPATGEETSSSSLNHSHSLSSQDTGELHWGKYLYFQNIFNKLVEFWCITRVECQF